MKGGGGQTFVKEMSVEANYIGHITGTTGGQPRVGFGNAASVASA
jgi:hypothetical protein